MAGPNPFSKRLYALPKMAEALKETQKQPHIGVTQGGSSRTKGAKPAATDGQIRPKRKK